MIPVELAIGVAIAAFVLGAILAAFVMSLGAVAGDADRRMGLK